MTDQQYRRINNKLVNSPAELRTLESFEKNIYHVPFNSTSQDEWFHTAPKIAQLIASLQATQPIQLNLKLTINRVSFGDEDIATKLTLAKSLTLANDTRQSFVSILQYYSRHSNTSHPTELNVHLPALLPKLLRVMAQRVEVLLDIGLEAERDLVLRLEPHNGGERLLWQMREVCGPPTDAFAAVCDPDRPQLVLFTDAIVSGWAWTKFSILTLYTTFTLFISRLLRLFTVGRVYNVQFTDLPQADLVMQLCYDIAVVRATGEFALEEDLYAKLLFLHRSPATLIEYTRWTVPPVQLESYVIQPEETLDDRKIEMLRARIE